MNKWIYTHKSDVIVVTNGMKAERALFVNGKLQDKKLRLISNELHGKSSEGERIKVNIGGLFKVKCKLYVDDLLLEPAEIDKRRNICEWTFQYGSDTIYTMFKASRSELYVNGNLQDCHKPSYYENIVTSTLYGKLYSGEEIKVRISEATFEGMKCDTYINDVKRKLEEIDETTI